MGKTITDYEEGDYLKIFIDFCEEDPKEDEEAGRLMELLRDNMESFTMKKWQDCPNKVGEKMHSCYFIHNSRHYEI